MKIRRKQRIQALLTLGVVAARDFNRMTESLQESREALARERAELQKREALFRSLFDQSPLGTAIVAGNFRFIDVNETLSKIVGTRRGASFSSCP